MPELGLYGSVRGALSNERPYRDQVPIDNGWLLALEDLSFVRCMRSYRRILVTERVRRQRLELAI